MEVLISLVYCILLFRVVNCILIFFLVPLKNPPRTLFVYEIQENYFAAQLPALLYRAALR